jgi:hypothetical protein
MIVIEKVQAIPVVDLQLAIIVILVLSMIVIALAFRGQSKRLAALEAARMPEPEPHTEEIPILPIQPQVKRIRVIPNSRMGATQ